MQQRQRTWWWMGMLGGLLLVVLSLLATPVWGAILYVDKDNSCPGNGSTSTPYCSIANATNVANPGDSIRIRDSATPYDEQVTMTRSGTAGSPIIIEPDVGHNPTLRYTGNGAIIGMLHLLKNSYVTIQNLTFNGAGVWTSTFAIWVQASTACTDAVAMPGIKILNNTFQNWGGNATQTDAQTSKGVIWMSPGGACDNSVISAAIAAPEIRGNLFQTNRFAAMTIQFTNDAVIENNIIEGTLCGRNPAGSVDTLGIWIGKADRARAMGFGMQIHNNIFRDFQLFSACGLSRQGASFETHAAIWCDVETFNGLISQNTIANINYADALGSYNGSEGVFLEAGCAGWKVWNNVIHHVGDAGIRQSVRRPGEGYPANEYYHNTIYAIKKDGFQLDYAGSESSPSEGPSIIKNNIVMDAAQHQIAFQSAVAETHIIDNNLYYDSTGSKIGLWSGGSTLDFAGWKAACGCDQNSLNADPVFVTTGVTPDLQLQTSSPAKDTGVTIGSITTDLLGMTRPQGSAYDMGAYEFVVGGGGSPDITSNLALWWKFNDGSNTTAADSSPGGHPGTLSGTTLPTWTTGCQLTGCLTFNGSTAYVTAGASNIVGGGANTVFTLSAWVKLPTSPPVTKATILSNEVTGGTSQYFLAYNTAGNIEVYYQTNTGGTIYRYGQSTTAGAIPANTWVHVVWVNSADSDAGQTVYVNGSPHALTYSSAGAATVPSTSFGVTAVGRDGSNAQQYWPGLIDDVRIYTRALSSTDVTALYQYTEPTGDITTNLVVRWKLDEGANTSLTDDTGNGHTGTLAGSPTTPTWSTSCHAGACLAFDGIDDAFSFTGVATGTTWTWAAWLFPTTGGSGDGFLFAQNGVDAIYYEHSGANPNKLLVDGSTYSAGALTLNTWSHVAVVNTAGTVTFYINGAASGTGGAGISITADRVGDGYQGRMDDIRFYSRALAAADVLTLYQLTEGGSGGGSGGVPVVLRLIR